MLAQLAAALLLPLLLQPGRPARERPPLLLASHGRLQWLRPDFETEVVLQSSDSVFHGTFSGINERDPEVWVVSRPHNWRPSTAEEKLLLVSTDVEELVKSTVVVPSRFAHDAIRRLNVTYVCSTGDGAILVLQYPSMQLVRRLDVFTPQQHANTLAAWSPRALYVLLHNHGQSDIVGLDTETNEIFWTYRGVGKQAHGLVVWKEDLPGHTQETPNQHAYFITLSSGEGAVHRVDAQDGTVQRLWQAPVPGTFLKGLCVVDDVAYFGLSPRAPRSARADRRLSCEVAALNLTDRRLLWRHKVETQGLLNSISTPSLGQGSPYRALHQPEW